MTDVYQPSTAAIPTSSKGATDQTVFFSNAGELAFKPSVRIYCGSNVKPPDEQHETCLADGEHIKTGWNAPHDTANPHVEEKPLSVADNARLLARMCLKAQEPTQRASHVYSSAHESSLQRLSVAPRDELDTLSGMLTAAPAFERLVQEYIREGEPEFEQWMELNPKRKMQPYVDAKKMYNEIRTSNRFTDAFKWMNPFSAKNSAKRNLARISNQVVNTVHEEERRINKQAATQRQHKIEQMKQHISNHPINPTTEKHMLSMMKSRIDNLEAHTAEMSEGILQNHDVLRTKFAELQTRLDAHEDQLEQADQMSDAMHVNNKTLRDKFATISQRLDAHGEQLDGHTDILNAHETGLQNHHTDIQRMAFDTGSKRMAPSAPDIGEFAPAPMGQHIDINQLNAMALAF